MTMTPAKLGDLIQRTRTITFHRCPRNSKANRLAAQATRVYSQAVSGNCSYGEAWLNYANAVALLRYQIRNGLYTFTRNQGYTRV
jgi:hypothetical protein